MLLGEIAEVGLDGIFAFACSTRPLLTLWLLLLNWDVPLFKQFALELEALLIIGPFLSCCTLEKLGLNAGQSLCVVFYVGQEVLVVF